MNVKEGLALRGTTPSDASVRTSMNLSPSVDQRPMAPASDTRSEVLRFIRRSFLVSIGMIGLSMSFSFGKEVQAHDGLEQSGDDHAEVSMQPVDAQSTSNRSLPTQTQIADESTNSLSSTQAVSVESQENGLLGQVTNLVGDVTAPAANALGGVAESVNEVTTARRSDAGTESVDDKSHEVPVQSTATASAMNRDVSEQSVASMHPNASLEQDERDASVSIGTTAASNASTGDVEAPTATPTTNKQSPTAEQVSAPLPQAKVEQRSTTEQAGAQSLESTSVHTTAQAVATPTEETNATETSGSNRAVPTTAKGRIDSTVTAGAIGESAIAQSPVEVSSTNGVTVSSQAHQGAANNAAVEESTPDAPTLSLNSLLGSTGQLLKPVVGPVVDPDDTAADKGSSERVAVAPEGNVSNDVRADSPRTDALAHVGVEQSTAVTRHNVTHSASQSVDASTGPRQAETVRDFAEVLATQQTTASGAERPTGLLGTLTGTLTPALDPVLRPVTDLVDPVLGSVGGLAGGEKEAAGAVTNQQPEVLAATPDVVSGVLGPVLDPATGLLDGVLAPVVQTVKPVADTVLRPVNSVTSSLGDGSGRPGQEVLAVEPLSAHDDASAPTGGLLDGVLTPATDLLQPVVQPVRSLAGSLTGAGTSGQSQIAPGEPTRNGTLLDQVLGVAAPVLDPVTDALSPVTDSVGSVGDTVNGTVTGLTGSDIPVVSPAVDSTTTVLSSTSNGASSLLNSLLSSPPAMVGDQVAVTSPEPSDRPALVGTATFVAPSDPPTSNDGTATLNPAPAIRYAVGHQRGAAELARIMQEHAMSPSAGDLLNQSTIEQLGSGEEVALTPDGAFLLPQEIAAMIGETAEFQSAHVSSTSGTPSNVGIGARSLSTMARTTGPGPGGSSGGGSGSGGDVSPSHVAFLASSDMDGQSNAVAIRLENARGQAGVALRPPFSPD